MKKYIVKHTLFGKFGKSSEAVQEFKKYINNFYGDAYIPNFDLELEEVECDEVNEVITDFESARLLLFGKDYYESSYLTRRSYNGFIPIKYLEMILNEINPKHIVALIALNRLFTIADAWNKSDGFVPDFSDLEQYKYYPLFVYDKVDAKFKFSKSMSTYVSANFGSRICFKTGERAEQFGKQFENLFNKVLMDK